jgi:hypothetical protein
MGSSIVVGPGCLGGYCFSHADLLVRPLLGSTRLTFSLIMAPVFFSAYLYTMTGMAIMTLGPRYSMLTPRWASQSSHYVLMLMSST